MVNENKKENISPCREDGEPWGRNIFKGEKQLENCEENFFLKGKKIKSFQHDEADEEGKNLQLISIPIFLFSK